MALRLSEGLGLTAPQPVRDGSDYKQSQGQYVRLDDGGQGCVVVANRDGEREERNYAYRGGNKCEAVQMPMEGRIGQEGCQQAEEHCSVAHEDLKVRVLYSNAVEARHLCGADNSDEWKRVNQCDKEQDGGNDEAHGSGEEFWWGGCTALTDSDR